jgi:hypothetical protein
VRSLLAGWAISGIPSIRSGFPVTILSGARHEITTPTVTGIVNGPVRPNASGAFEFSPKPAGAQGSPVGRATTGAQPISNYAASLGLSQPLLGNFGTLGRNSHRLNGEVNFDLNVYKNFSAWERTYFQIRAEFYNAFNNTSFQQVDRTLISPTFGNYLDTTNNGRFIQFGARFVF